MSYEALTLKYRPQRLKQLVGQEAVVDIIQGMLETGRVGRTLLISGPYGSGKTTTARMFARYVNCMGERENMAEPPCGECAACTRMDKGGFNDYSEINAAEARGIDEVRSILNQALYKPQSRYRIFVLDEVHKFTTHAWDAFLKMLEEPPKNTVFILCTTDPQKIPKMVVSRCKKLNIQHVPPAKTIKVLRRVVKGEGLDTEVYNVDLLEKIAMAVDGHPRDSIMTLEAIIDRIAGKGGIAEIDDINNFVLDIADEVVGEKPEKVAGNFLLGIYAGKYTRAILPIRDVTYHSTFIDLVLEFHAHAMYHRFSPKLTDKLYTPWYNRIQEEFSEKKLDAEGLSKVMDVLVEIAPKIKEHTIDPYYGLLNAATKCVNIMQGLVVD